MKKVLFATSIGFFERRFLGGKKKYDEICRDFNLIFVYPSKRSFGEVKETLFNSRRE